MQPETAQTTDKKPKYFYDATAKNRFAYEVREGGEVFDTAHIFNPISDERYLQMINSFKIKGDDEDLQEDSRAAMTSAWDDVIDTVENIEAAENWKALIPAAEKIKGLDDLTSVAIAETETKAQGPRRLGAETGSKREVETEAFFNGKIVRQRHVLIVSPEFEKKYDRIQKARFKQEQTRGLRRKPKIEFVPQDARIAALYDEMFDMEEGFVEGIIPIRFKTAVVHHIFAPTIDAKK